MATIMPSKARRGSEGRKEKRECKYEILDIIFLRFTEFSKGWIVCRPQYGLAGWDRGEGKWKGEVIRLHPKRMLWIRVSDM